MPEIRVSNASSGQQVRDNTTMLKIHVLPEFSLISYLFFPVVSFGAAGRLLISNIKGVYA